MTLAPTSQLDRLLLLAGGDDPAHLNTKVTAFRRILLILVPVEYINAFPRLSELPTFPFYVGLVIALVVCALLGWRDRWAGPATVTAAVAYAGLLGLGFPLVANHQYLILISLALLSLLGRREADEQALLLCALKWMIVIGIFYAGVQKVLHGYYFEGEALAYFIRRSERFRALFGWVVPASEMARLAAIELGEGAGPFKSSSTRLLVLSNLSYLGELVLPPLLLVRRFRTPALWVSLFYFAAIEAGARELVFVGVLIAFVSLFAAGDLVRKLLPVVVALCLYLLAAGYGLLPAWYGL